MKTTSRRARCEGLFLGWLLLGMALFAFLQVVLRYLFHTGFSWGEELNRYLCILLTFTGAVLGVERGSHFSMDVLRRVLPPGLSLWVERLVLLLSAMIYAVTAWYGFIQVARLHRFASHSPALQLPMSGLYLIIPLGCTLMAWRSLKAIISPRLKCTGPPAGELPRTTPEPTPGDTKSGRPKKDSAGGQKP